MARWTLAQAGLGYVPYILRVWERSTRSSSSRCAASIRVMIMRYHNTLYCMRPSGTEHVQGAGHSDCHPECRASRTRNRKEGLRRVHFGPGQHAERRFCQGELRVDGGSATLSEQRNGSAPRTYSTRMGSMRLSSDGVPGWWLGAIDFNLDEAPLAASTFCGAHHQAPDLATGSISTVAPLGVCQ